MIPLCRPLPPPLDSRHAWRDGDAVVALDGRPVGDVLDVYFHAAEGPTRVTIRRAGGVETDLVLAPEEVGPLTEAFAPPSLRTCACRCVFCFVDQNPPGLRPSVYHKDEDWRFSWLYGNYVTLTSLGRAGVRRIVEQHLSPLYVSVHATDPELRARMLGVKRAPILPRLRELTAAGIEVHAQVVLVPGWNDGTVLVRTCEELAGLAPGVASVAVVPVGLTRHRRGLTPLRRPTPAEAARALADLEPLRRRMRRECGGRFVHLSDELYLLAGRPPPGPRAYEGFPQLDDGVGLTAHLAAAWTRRLRALARRGAGPRASLTVLTGALAARSLGDLVVPRLRAAGAPPVEVVAVRNRLFGTTVTVAGLLCGADLRGALAALPPDPPRLVALPPRAFNAAGLTLDDWDRERLAAGLPHRVVVPPEERFIDFWSATG